MSFKIYNNYSEIKNELEPNSLVNDDCLKVMEKIPDESIDCILCDLPYGTTQNKWDSAIDLKLLWKDYERIIKNRGIILLFAQTPFDKILGYSNISLLKYEWIWEKSKATGFLNAKKIPLKAHENILVFYKNTPIYNPQVTKGLPYNKGLIKSQNGHGSYSNFNEKLRKNDSGNRLPRDVVYFKTAETEGKTIHPTQKPVGLIEYLIKTYTNENMTILDNCMGSGTTGVACVHLNRKFIGIEWNPTEGKHDEYFKLAINRIQNSLPALIV